MIGRMKLSRSGLNIVIFACVALIFILHKPANAPKPRVVTPDLPQYKIQQWKLANGTQVHFLPLVESQPTQIGWVWNYHWLDQPELIEATSKQLLKPAGNWIRQTPRLDRLIWRAQLSTDLDEMAKQVQQLKTLVTHPNLKYLKAIGHWSRSDYQDVWRRQFRGRSLDLVIMGAISQKESRIMAEVIAGSIPPGDSPSQTSMEKFVYSYPIQQPEDLFLLQLLQLAKVIQPISSTGKGRQGWMAAPEIDKIAPPEWDRQKLDTLKRRLASRWYDQLRDPEKRFWWLVSSRGQFVDTPYTHITDHFRLWFGNLNAKKFKAQVQSYQTRWQNQQSTADSRW